MTAVAPPPAHEPARQIDSREYFAAYPLAAILESPLNPRRHYEVPALQELAEQLRATGQLTPGLARPHPSGDTVLVDGVEWLVVELGAGHRRRRALEMAGIPTMELVRRRLDQAEFVELLTVENLQRDDLHPLEEAEGFKTLMEQAGYDIGRLAARVGKDRRTIYDRLKLLQLIEPAKQLFEAGRFELGHAVLLARLSPSDQERAIASERSGNGRIGGLFVHEQALEPVDPHPEEPFDEMVGSVKPVSVREFKGWIDQHVRFRPEAEDLPNLFPETEAALASAQEQELKVVKITREHLPSDEAKDPSERTFGNKSWKRADGLVAEPVDWKGEAEAKTCDRAVMGVVVAGPGRGEAFLVCTARKTCKVHWAREMRQAAKRAKEGPRSHQPDQAEDWKARQAREDAERKRWEKARPAILEDLAARLPAVSMEAVAEIVLEHCGEGSSKKVAAALLGDSLEAVLRRGAYLVVADGLHSAWLAEREWPKLLKPLGIDAKKIRDRVAPLPTAEKPATQKAAKAKKKGKKKLAGDVRRTAAKAKAAGKAKPKGATAV